MRRSLALVLLATLALGGCASANGDAIGARAGVRRQPPPGTCHQRGRGLTARPDPRCTPGATDPAVTQADIEQTICVPGYSERLRPPESVTEREKRASLTAYGDHGPLRAYEYDHLVPLSLGGAPNSPRNLWPEPGASPNLKDGLEYRLHDLVCEYRMPLRTAQREIAHDWVSMWKRLGRPRA